MRWLELDDLDREAEAYDRAALATADVDRFCSSSAWVVPAARALMEAGEARIATDGENYAVFVVRAREGRRVLEPLELSWALASPLVGRDPGAIAELAAAAIDRGPVDLAVVAGVVPGSPLVEALRRRLGRHHRLGLGPVTRRHVASLDGGVDGFLARRSRELRRGLRKAERRAHAAGIGFEHHAPADAAAADALFDRVLAVEAGSWKGQGGTGLADPAMAAFYRAMLRRLATRGAGRLTLARLGARDVGFVLGARFADSYRGLQFGFDDALRDLALGNLGQLRVVERLSDEGVRRYDLGTGGDYKPRWAERVFDTVAVVVSGR